MTIRIPYGKQWEFRPDRTANFPTSNQLEDRNGVANQEPPTDQQELCGVFVFPL